MTITLDRAADTTSVDGLLSSLDDTLTHLIATCDTGALNGLDNPGLIRTLRHIEIVRNRLPAVDNAVLRAAEDRAMATTIGARNLTGLLATTLRLSRSEARHRVAAMEATAARPTLIGPTLPPLRPALAAAQRGGTISSDHVTIIASALRWLDHAPGVDPAEVGEAEQALVAYAHTFDPPTLRILADRVTAHLFPDGDLAKDTARADRRSFGWSGARDPDAGPGGDIRAYGRLTPGLAEKLHAVLGPLAAPRTAGDADAVDPDGRDDRTPGQRMHDALEQALDRLLATAGLPASGGTPATVILTIDAADYAAMTGHGTTSSGQQIPARTVREMSTEAEVVVAVINDHGAPLMMGRQKRIATPAQTLAPYARDGGCTFPGCDHPPEWCERHHIVPWIDGGPTDLTNLALVCAYHHRWFAEHGWQIRMGQHGLPEWLPPAWVDPRQRPVQSARVTARHIAHGQ